MQNGDMVVPITTTSDYLYVMMFNWSLHDSVPSFTGVCTKCIPKQCDHLKHLSQNRGGSFQLNHVLPAYDQTLLVVSKDSLFDAYDQTLLMLSKDRLFDADIMQRQSV